MNLSIIKDFFTCIGNLEELRVQKISAFRSMFPRINMFSLFKQLSSSTAHINAIHMKQYLSQFSHNLQIIDPNQINNLASSKNFTSTKRLTNDQVLQKGISMFLSQWGNCQKQFTFSEFSKFFNDQQCLPQQPQQVPYHARKKLFQIIETEIQGLLNMETIRQVCIKQYKNLPDLFETIASKQTQQLSIKSIKNLYLMHGQRINEEFYQKIENRLKLPISFHQFITILKTQQLQKNPKLQQRKVYYSSARRKKDMEQLQQGGDYFDEYSQKNDQYDKISRLSNSRHSIQFQTPKTQKGNIQNRGGITSTKLTKGEKITNNIKQPSVTVGRFKSQQTPQRLYSNTINKASVATQQIQILGEILNYQQQFIKLKRNLCLRRDMDLQLAYQRVGSRFSKLLNELYGCCNFSSFARFIIPKDFQYKYLAYVRHQVSNKLSQETLILFEQLLQAYERKQYQIRELWSKVDKQMIFRMYCNPGQEGINVQQLTKYFSDRECKVLAERMDPLGSGIIQCENFC